MSSSRRSVFEESDEEEPASSRQSRKRSVATSAADDSEDEEDVGGSQVAFSSQYPDMSQAINAVKTSEQTKLFNLTEETREKAIADLSRAVLFKALAHEAIDRVKCAKDAGVEGKLANALYEQVQNRLHNIFGFQLMRIPAFMENMKNLPEKYKNRYYLVNPLPDQHGEVHKLMHAVHDDCAKEKGLLMVVLSLTYCQGFPRTDGSRWILDRDLFSLLHQLDENIPSEPMEAGSKKKRMPSQHSQGRGGKALQTPDVDAALDMFEKRDYLLKLKAAEVNPAADTEENHYYYSMGPRAMLEIGRKQVIYFCSEILDQNVDAHMLKELEADGEEVA